MYNSGYFMKFFNALSAPPELSLSPPELYCDVPLEDGRPVIIKWTVSGV